LIIFYYRNEAFDGGGRSVSRPVRSRRFPATAPAACPPGSPPPSARLFNYFYVAFLSICPLYFVVNGGFCYLFLCRNLISILITRLSFFLSRRSFLDLSANIANF
jgi:hypothetical protein